MKINMIIYSVLFIYGIVAFAADEHSSMINHKHKADSSEKILTEAGNDAFGTIQEVIRRLNSDPNTDWTKVNLEALRLHLMDMNDMTLNVEVISQKPIHNGLEVIIRPTTDRAALALDKVFKAHLLQFKKDTGWNMKVVKNNGQYTILTTSDNTKDEAKIRGLGYIGLMVYGDHHQRHHWAMATGNNPHKMQH
jgi:hypothetical protein